jgi:nucleotide-binding universal stress UspA family protein
MKKILVPIDFSELTTPIIRYALDISKALNAELVLLHCYNSSYVMGTAAFPDTIAAQAVLDAQYTLDMRIRYEQKLKEALQTAHTLANELGISEAIVSKELCTGDPAQEIRNHCLSTKAHLIIMGAKGTGSKNHFSGSTTHKIIKHLTAPLLAIPQQSIFNGLDNILYASDLCHNNIDHLMSLLNFLKPFKSHVTIVNLCTTASNIPAELNNDQKDLLRASYPQGGLSFDTSICDDLHAGFHQKILEAKPNAIAIHSCRKAFFHNWLNPSLSRKDIYLENIPLLVLPCRS